MAVFLATFVCFIISLLLTLILVEYPSRSSDRADVEKITGDWFQTWEDGGRIHMTKIIAIEDIPFRGSRLLLDEVDSYCLKEHAHLASILSDGEAKRIARRFKLYRRTGLSYPFFLLIDSYNKSGERKWIDLFDQRKRIHSNPVYNKMLKPQKNEEMCSYILYPEELDLLLLDGTFHREPCRSLPVVKDSFFACTKWKTILFDEVFAKLNESVI